MQGAKALQANPDCRVGYSRFQSSLNVRGEQHSQSMQLQFIVVKAATYILLKSG